MADRTWDQLLSRIADETFRDDLTSQIQDHLAAAVRFYAPRRWWFNEGTMTGTLTAEYNALPTGTRVIDQVMAGVVTLRRVDNEYLEMLKNTGAQAVGQPYDWCQVGDMIRVYPVPATAYPLSVVGVFDLVPISGSQSNGWTTEAEDLIVQRAKKTLYRDVLKDPVNTGLAENAEGEAFTNLWDINTARIARGRMRRSF